MTTVLIRSDTSFSVLAQDVEKGGGGRRKVCAATVGSPESAVMSKTPDRYTHQSSSLQLFLHTHTRYKCQPHPLLHEPLNSLDRRKLECDV